jgi:hypothetical protein
MANGITDPEHHAAALAHIDSELARTKNTNLGNAQQSAFNNRMNVAQMLPGIYNNAASLGMSGLGNAAGLQLNNANNAFGMRRYNDANMIGGLGMAGSGRLGSMFGNMFGGNKGGTYSPALLAGNQAVQNGWNALDNQFGSPDAWVNSGVPSTNDWGWGEF